MAAKPFDDRAIHPVLLCGGTGSRLWPLSRALHPKQLLSLASDRSLLQETILRTSGTPFAAPTIICNEEYRFIVAEQIRELSIDPKSIILEREGRNTAPALAIAALDLGSSDPDALLLVLPTDHLIQNPEKFSTTVAAALAAANDSIIVFGVEPSRPETGYGYIRRGKQLELAPGTFHVDAFTEKPDLATAQEFLSDGGYYWNSGVFLVSAKRYLSELDRLQPAMLVACQKAWDGRRSDLDFVRIDADAFAQSEHISIDFAVMERTQDAVVVPLDAGWSDIGSWAELWEIAEKDQAGNVVVGDVITHDVKNSYLRSDGLVVAAVGLTDIVIVATDDVVLVVPRDGAQDVTKIVESMRKNQRKERTQHTIVHRPWGSYKVLEESGTFKVKRVSVNAGGKLSLQLHHRRVEHWVVVSGEAFVTRGEETLTLRQNESTFIPTGTKHRLENHHETEPLHIIEVQTGEYLGEDDIVRFDDVYGRGSAN
jgi:mannose-1-phosphate guanylyltransferase/mannose-6-phosphate isomerase